MPRFLYDSFNETSDMDITSHTGELGATWTKHSGSDAGYNAMVYQQRAYLYGATFANNVTYYCSGVPNSADYFVYAPFKKLTDINDQAITLLARHSTSAHTAYGVQYYEDPVAPFYSLAKWVAGAGTDLTSGSHYVSTIAVSGQDWVRLEVQGTAIRAYINGVLRLSATDSAVTAAGRPAFRMNQKVSTTSTGLVLGPIEAGDIARDSPRRAGAAMRGLYTR